MYSNQGYIISLKFAPGLKKEFSLIGRNMNTHGFKITYLLAKQYSLLDHNTENMLFLTNSGSLGDILLDSFKFIVNKTVVKLFPEKDIDFCLFYNNHILNIVLTKYLKRNFKNVKALLYFHDPYTDKRLYGTLKGIYIFFAELLVKFYLPFIDHIIFPSEYAYQLFLKHYKKFRGQCHIAPLLIPDQGLQKNKRREFFSIVGAYNNATGHDTFIDLVNHVAANGFNFKFALISSSNMGELLGKLSHEGRKFVKIINNKIINDSEIDEIIRQSYAVFRLDKEVTQSGVIPVAFMNATPIIATDIPGLTQHVKHDDNGYIVPLQCNHTELIKAMRHVKDHFARLSDNARESYQDIWAETTFVKYYSWLLPGKTSNQI